MPIFLNSSDSDFTDMFEALLHTKREFDSDVDAVVATILSDVRARADVAVIELTAKFDNFELTPETMTFNTAEIDAAIKTVPIEEREALELAAVRIQAYHQRQLPHDAWWTDDSSVQLGWRWTPIEKVGLYVPGGLASYPSSVLMNAIPAKVAGVENLSICVPTPRGEVNPLVLLAARLSGVETVYRIGGAQAVAAMAYGTKTVAKVDKITGPGNAFVAAAKRQVYGTVGIDMIAGPSEILVIADKNNNPDWIAMDLLSQAEHDKNAQSILITNDAAFGAAVASAVEAALEKLERRDIAQASWQDFGAIIVVRDLDEAAMLSDRIAPEHLELCVANAEMYSKKIRHAGAIFIGAWTPEAIGDYVGGPNHVLPTARSARFSSGLNVLDFMKRTTLAQVMPEALRTIGAAAEKLAQSESLQAHALSVRARLDQLNKGVE
ncbi:MAG: histidinol dehydrogenase [Amylibacter sp.]|nr:histidinol dehydrogenase [Amylibacter sp.]MDG1997916.1 histidinol dehydrogenase [Amylibacter sp.]